MPGCILRYCKNNLKNLKKSEGISYHRFPRPGHEKRVKWIEFVRKDRSENMWLPTEYSRVCSEHFSEKDYYNTKNGRRFLIKSAVPFHIPEDSENNPNQSPNSLIDVDVSDSESILDTPSIIKLKEDLRKITDSKRNLLIKNKKLKRQCRHLKSRNQKLTDVIKELRTNIIIYTDAIPESET